jgi:hypothetical protein
MHGSMPCVPVPARRADRRNTRHNGPGAPVGRPRPGRITRPITQEHADHGRILRIDFDGGSVGHPYGIPADNPFASVGRYDSPFPGQPPAGATPTADEQGITTKEPKYASPVRQEIWAYGLGPIWRPSALPHRARSWLTPRWAVRRHQRRA